VNPFVQEIARFISKFTPIEEAQVQELIEVPKNAKLGDYAFPCFALAKAFKKPPAAVAAVLANTAHDWRHISQANAAGPYLNFSVDRTAFAQYVLESILRSGVGYGNSDEGNGKKVVVDFSSPNILKPFAVHHLRSTGIGNSICRLYEALGYECVRVNHLGDWGTPVGKIMVAFDRWGDAKELKAHPTYELFRLYVKFGEEAKKDERLNDEARKRFSRLEGGDVEAVAQWMSLREACLRELKRVYRMLGIEFDSYAGESFYRDAVDGVVGLAVDAGLAIESEGALVVPLDEFGMPPCILRKRDEATVYATRDIAAALYRWEHYGFAKMVYVTDAGQSLHFRQFFKVLELMGKDWIKTAVHVPFGLLNFKGGKMSTRHGNVILLEEVLKKSIQLTRAIIEEKNPELEDKDRVARDVGVGAVVFADLSSKRNKNVEFDWDQVLNFNGETGPYVQYTHARFCSVLRKYGQKVPDRVDAALLADEAEYAVIRILERLPSVIAAAAKAYEPSLVAGYLLDLCTEANRFYNECRVLSDNEPLTRARVALTYCIAIVLRKGLLLLGMKAPEQM